jgi:hypothetical protein
VELILIVQQHFVFTMLDENAVFRTDCGGSFEERSRPLQAAPSVMNDALGNLTPSTPTAHRRNR